MDRTPHKIILFRGLPRQSAYWLGAALTVSLLMHLMSLVSLSRVNSNPLAANLARTNSEKVPVRIIKKPRKAETGKESQKLLETQLNPTEPPKQSSRLGAQDHATQKQTKVSELTPRPKAADPGQMGEVKSSQRISKPSVRPLEQEQGKNEKQRPNSKISEQKSQKRVLVSPDGLVSIPRPGENHPRNLYEALIPKSRELAKQVQAGYQDYVADEAEVGERIDFNTTNFRYLGYFTSVRKAFELVWTYPSEAVRRGLQGEVKLEFTIQKDGAVNRIRVLDSSGHKILDDAVIEAIKLASPFAPLPKGMNKDRLTIVGSFRYVLTNYAGAT